MTSVQAFVIRMIGAVDWCKYSVIATKGHYRIWQI